MYTLYTLIIHSTPKELTFIYLRFFFITYIFKVFFITYTYVYYITI